MKKNNPQSLLVMHLVQANYRIKEKGEELDRLTNVLGNFDSSQFFLTDEDAKKLKEVKILFLGLIEKAIMTNFDQQKEYREKLAESLQVQENNAQNELIDQIQKGK